MTHYATMTVEEFTNYKCKFTDDSKLFYWFYFKVTKIKP